jgi:hypothetical protein
MRHADYRTGVELTDDPLFAHRIRRLVVVSAVALGVITGLAVNVGAPTVSVVLIATGWVLMPVILAASLKRPTLRYTLVLPASVVTVGLVGVLVSTEGAAMLGWALITAGILLGGTLGMWFWYRLVPVPYALSDPYGIPRIALVALHIGLVLSGVVIVITST